MKVYLLHGTDAAGYETIGDGDEERGGFVGGGHHGVNIGFLQAAVSDSATSQASKRSWLGDGLYCTSSYSKAKSHGGYVYLLELELKKLKMVKRWDWNDAWRSDERIHGVYMPPGRDKRQDWPDSEDEFCVRSSTRKTVWLVRSPPHRRVKNRNYNKIPYFSHQMYWRAKEAYCFPMNVHVDKLYL